MSLPYKEGTCFTIRNFKGYIPGVVARISSKGGVFLGYFFENQTTKPNMSFFETISSSQKKKILRVGDLALMNHHWQTIGTLTNWDRSKWPVPQFLRFDELSEKKWKVYYSEDDINIVVKEEPLLDDINLEKDAVWGYGSIEVFFTKCDMSD